LGVFAWRGGSDGKWFRTQLEQHPHGVALFLECQVATRAPGTALSHVKPLIPGRLQKPPAPSTRLMELAVSPSVVDAYPHVRNRLPSCVGDMAFAGALNSDFPAGRLAASSFYFFHFSGPLRMYKNRWSWRTSNVPTRALGKPLAEESYVAAFSYTVSTPSQIIPGVQ